MSIYKYRIDEIADGNGNRYFVVQRLKRRFWFKLVWIDFVDPSAIGPRGVIWHESLNDAKTYLGSLVFKSVAQHYPE